MKFDFIIGNPPYQEEAVGDQKTFTPPVYHKFMSGSYSVGKKVELITPARFLFNAGSTPKDWNERMLSDEHLKIIDYEVDSSKLFANTDIKGGVAITYRDADSKLGPIGTFVPFSELRSILSRVIVRKDFAPISDIVYSRSAFRLTNTLHEEHPEVSKKLSAGHLYDMSTNIFDLLPEFFYVKKPNNKIEHIQIFGRQNNERTYRYIRADYVNQGCNLYDWKIFVPKANGSGTLGEVLTTPVIGQPVIGHTESFMSIGKFATQDEAEAALKYIKSKFARVLLGILKVTQDNPQTVWKYVPLQDFTEHSDIDWTASIGEIDRQLYAKYGLSDEEIAFIETRVKEMA